MIEPEVLFLDSEGLSALARGNQRALALVAAATRRDVDVVTSSLVLTETLRGKPFDVPIHRYLRGVEVVDVTRVLARRAGALLGRLGRPNTVDSVVAVSAAASGRRTLLVTGDPDDLGPLTDDMASIRLCVL